MIQLPPEPTRGEDILTWARRVQDVLRRLRLTAGPGIRLIERGNNTVITTDLGGGGGATPSTHPFQIFLRPNPETEGAWQAMVHLESDLYRSLSHTDKQTITGLDSWFTTAGDAETPDRIWLEGTFASWPTLNEVEIHSDGMGDDWGDGEIEDDGDADNPQQTAFRLVLGRVLWSDEGTPSVEQIIRTHLRMSLRADQSFAVAYPEIL